MLKLLVLEDEPLVRRALVRVICSAAFPVRVTEAEDYDCGVLGLERGTDGLIVDIGVPGGTGLNLLRAARTSGVLAPALVVTGRPLTRALVDEVRSLDALLLLKPFDTDDLHRFLQKVADRKYMSLAPVLDALRDFASAWHLSEQQAKIVWLAARGLKHRADIASALGVEPGTVKTQVTRILQKTRQNTLADVVDLILKHVGHEAVLYPFPARPRRCR